jgi:xanthine dehydrogenase YagS FAD-binding subunit
MNDFTYSRASDVAHAVQAISAPGARYLGAGTNLLDLAKYDVEHPRHLVDVSRLPFDKIEELPNGGLRIGAMVRNTELANHSSIRERYTALSSAILQGATQQIRNMATTGGNLLQRTRCYYFYDATAPCNKRVPGTGCGALDGYNRIHAILGQSQACIATHPSDMAVAMRIFDAVVRVQGPQGERAIPIADFHRLPADRPHVDTNLQAGELILALELPPVAFGRGSHYLKVRDRASYAFALVSVAAAIDAPGGTIREARIALGGVAHKPWRAEAAEAYLRGRPANAETFAQAAQLELKPAKGYEHNRFKVELAKRSIVRALDTVMEGKA